MSVVVCFRYMSVSMCDVFLTMSKSRKLIQFLYSYVGLSRISVCTWFMYVLIRSGFVLVVPYMISISST